MKEVLNGQKRVPLEWEFISAETYKDPFNEIELDVIIKDNTGGSWKVPAFWAGESKWKIRFSAPHTGKFTYESICTNSSDTGLNGRKGQLEITEYTGNNPLYVHGPIRVMKNGRYFEHEDGTPFPWLGDTWWPLLTSRINNTDEVEMLAADRQKKGFTFIAFLNGFYCDVMPGDKRLKNEAGFAWTEGFETLNPEYYNVSDSKIKTIVDHGLVPGVTGSWGFYLGFLGVEKMKKHFRNMIARYAAYPVIWILAGETLMPRYDILLKGEGTPEYQGWIKDIKPKWSEVLEYLKKTDPYNRLTSTHVSHGHIASDEVDNAELLDYNEFQAGFHDESYDMINEGIKNSTKRGYEMQPVRPVVNEESPYEGMLYQCGPNVQRWIFWHSMLSGCAGWTYGANGIFNMSHKDDPFGTAVYGINWGEMNWQESYQYEGGKQAGACRKYLNKYEWWRLKPANDKVVIPEDAEAWTQSVAAEIPGELIIAYSQPFVRLMTMFNINGIKFRNLKPGDSYNVYAYNPIRDYELDLGETVVGEDGTYSTPRPPVAHDWVYVLKKLKK